MAKNWGYCDQSVRDAYENNGTKTGERPYKDSIDFQIQFLYFKEYIFTRAGGKPYIYV